MKRGEVEVQGGPRSGRVALKMGFGSEELIYYARLSARHARKPSV